MSGEFEILAIGAVALGAVAALAVAPIALAGYGVYKAGEAVYTSHQNAKRRLEEERRVQEEIQRKQNESYYRQMQEMHQSYQQVVREHEEALSQITVQMHNAMAEAYSGFQKDLESAGNMQALERHAAELEQEIKQEWSSKREQLTKQYEQKLHTAFQSVSRQLTEGREKLSALQNAVKDDPRKAEIAQEAINQAKAALELYQIEANQPNTRYTAELNEAVRYFNEKDFDMAFSKAHAVALTCLEQLEAIKQHQNVWFVLSDEIMQKLFVLEERISRMKSVHLAWQGQIFEEDLTRFEPAMMEGLAKHTQTLKQRFEQFQTFRKDDIPQLRTLLADCSEADLDAIEIAKYAAAKMALAYSGNQNAEAVTAALEEQGFRMEEYAYESGIEGNPMHINLVNDISGERLTAVLTPLPHGIQVQVHNYGAEGTGNIQTQNMIQQVLQNALGQQGKCHNPGGVSDQTVDADLRQTQNKPAQQSAAAQNLAQNL